MAITETTNLKLQKQDLGDTSWHTAVNTSFDRLDSKLALVNAGDPNGVVTADFVGQRCYDTTNDVIWFAKTAAATVWVLPEGPEVVDTDATILALDPTSARYSKRLAYATDTKRLYISDGVDWLLIASPPIVVDSVSTATTAFGVDPTWTALAGFSPTPAVAIPSLGVWEVSVRGSIWVRSGGSLMGVRLKEDDGVNPATYPVAVAHYHSVGDTSDMKDLIYRLAAAVAGRTYTYSIEGSASGVSSNHKFNQNAAGLSMTGLTPTSRLIIEASLVSA